jgi:hypothetical protein
MRTWAHRGRRPWALRLSYPIRHLLAWDHGLAPGGEGLVD